VNEYFYLLNVTVNPKQEKSLKSTLHLIPKLLLPSRGLHAY